MIDLEKEYEMLVSKLNPNDKPLVGSALKKAIKSVVEESENIEQTAQVLSLYFDNSHEDTQREIREITKGVIFEYVEKQRNGGYNLCLELEYELALLEKGKFYITKITDDKIIYAFSNLENNNDSQILNFEDKEKKDEMNESIHLLNFKDSLYIDNEIEKIEAGEVKGEINIKDLKNSPGKFTKDNVEFLFPELLEIALDEKKDDKEKEAGKETALKILESFQKKSIVNKHLSYFYLNELLGKQTHTYHEFQNKIDLIKGKNIEPETEEQKAEKAYQQWKDSLDSEDLAVYEKKVALTLQNIEEDLKNPKWNEIFKRVQLIKWREQLLGEKDDGKYSEEKERILKTRIGLEQKHTRLQVSNLYVILYLRENLIRNSSTPVEVIDHLRTNFLNSIENYSEDDICSDKWPVWNALVGDFVSTTQDGFLGYKNVWTKFFHDNNRAGIQLSVLKNLLFMQKFSADKKLEKLITELKKVLEENKQLEEVKRIEKEVSDWINNWEKKHAVDDIENELKQSENLDNLDDLLSYLENATVTPEKIHEFIHLNKDKQKECRIQITKWIISGLNEHNDTLLQSIAKGISDYFVCADNKKEIRQLVMADTLFILVDKLPPKNALRALKVFIDLPLVTQHNFLGFGETATKKECEKKIKETEERIKKQQEQEKIQTQEEEKKQKQDEINKKFDLEMKGLQMLEKTLVTLPILEKVQERLELIKKHQNVPKKILTDAKKEAYKLFIDISNKASEADLYLKKYEIEVYKDTKNNFGDKTIQLEVIRKCKGAINRELTVHYPSTIENKIKDRKTGLNELKKHTFAVKPIDDLLTQDKLILEYRSYILAASSKKTSEKLNKHIAEQIKKLADSDQNPDREKDMRNKADEIEKGNFKEPKELEAWCKREFDANTSQCYYKLWKAQSSNRPFLNKLADVFWRILGWKKPHDSAIYKQAGVKWGYFDFFSPPKESVTGQFVEKMSTINPTRSIGGKFL